MGVRRQDRARQWAFLQASLLALALALPAPAPALDAPEGFLPVEGRIAADGSWVELTWPSAHPPKIGNAVVMRRPLGATGADSWQVIAPKLGAALRFVDAETRAGQAYEYRVQREALVDGHIIDVGVWATGVEVPAVRHRGSAILAIDDSIAEPLAAWIDRFEMDLVGDGWQVRRLSTPRGNLKHRRATLVAAQDLKRRIAQLYRQDPSGGHALILIGHVPMVLSGRTAPDGHEPEPHATDLFYADIEGIWPDDGAGRLLPNRVPSGQIAMPVGRIDFRGQSAGDAAREIDLLRSYFDRNHAWRHGYIGDLRRAYGQSRHLIGERHALANIVGPESVTPGGHHDVARDGPWLLGVDFGHHRGADYAKQDSIKTVFAINFGSHKQKIDRDNNAMGALLAQPWYPLAVGWGGRPTWRLHAMALGGSMGDAQMRTVNNGRPREAYPQTMEYLPTGDYIWRNPIWVNLLGDPTAHPFPLAPPRNLRAEAVNATVRLSWEPASASDVTGYEVYRAERQTGPYRLLTVSPQIARTRFTDTDPIPGAWYMVRTLGLKHVYAGSFFTLSQGQFTTVGNTPVKAPILTLATTPSAAVRLPPETFPGARTLFAPVAAPPNAAVTRSGAGWKLTPADGFVGEIPLRYAVSDGLTSAMGTIELGVGND